MKCTLCKIQNVGKSEISFNIRLNNRRIDVRKPDALLACRHFQDRNQTFNKHEKFTIVDQLTNITQSKDTLRQRLIEKQNS